MCAGSTPIPAQIDSSRPVPAESCPPVMAVVSLSEITMVMFVFSLTQSSNPVIPEWGKCRISYDGNSRKDTRISRSFRHGDGRPHINTGVDRTEWRQSAQRIADQCRQILWHRHMLSILRSTLHRHPCGRILGKGQAGVVRRFQEWRNSG